MRRGAGRRRARGPLARRGAAALLAAAAAAPTAAEPEAGWNEPNIVLVGPPAAAKWRKLPPTPSDSSQLPFPPMDERWKSNTSSIVVLIAALREGRLVDTLYSMFTEATHPQRVIAGVVQQNAPQDVDAVEGLCKKFGTPLVRDESEGKGDPNLDTGDKLRGSHEIRYKNPEKCEYFNRIRMYRMMHTEAKGPAYARGRQRHLIGDADDFCMQIDAHTLFIKGWDERLLGEWGATRNEFAVLSTYPTNVHDLHKNSNNHWEMPHLCGASFEGQGRVRNAQARAAANLDRPIIAPLWAAGLSFARCHAERDVPTDPTLAALFMGEEFGRGARLWTHGYDFYSITRPIIGTYYGGEKGGRGHFNYDQGDSRRTSSRLATLLQWRDSDQSQQARDALGKYGVGNRRTLRQYYDWCGVDPTKMTIDMHCIVEWVRWEEDENVAEKRRIAKLWTPDGERREQPQEEKRVQVETKVEEQAEAKGEEGGKELEDGKATGEEAKAGQEGAEDKLVQEKAEAKASAEAATPSPPPPEREGTVLQKQREEAEEVEEAVTPPPRPRQSQQMQQQQREEQVEEGDRGEADAASPLRYALCFSACVLLCAAVPLLRGKGRPPPPQRVRPMPQHTVVRLRG